MRHRRKCVGTNQVRTICNTILFKELLVNTADNMRLCDIALHGAIPILEALTVVLILVELVLLRIVPDHRAHRSIVNGNLTAEQLRDVRKQR
jgi:hypothetical protein